MTDANQDDCLGLDMTMIKEPIENTVCTLLTTSTVSTETNSPSNSLQDNQYSFPKMKNEFIKNSWNMELSCYYIQVLHVIIVFLWVSFLLAVKDPYNYYRRNNFDLPVGLTIFGISVLTTVYRAFIGQFNSLAYLTNIQFINEVCRRGSFHLKMIGQCDPAVDLAFMLQFLSYLCILTVARLSFSGLMLGFAALISWADFLCFRLRVVQGSCNLKESWKTCPLVDTDGEVRVISERPTKTFALSYRWVDDNKDGFSEKHREVLYKLAKGKNANAGFVDCVCKWENGDMATLDVNKSIYSTADIHFVYTSRQVFYHFRFRMKWKFFCFFILEGLIFVSAGLTLPLDWIMLVLFFIAVLVEVNHMKNYLTWGMQNILPGFQRVWLRLEYECRRGNLSPSYLFDEEGVFSTVSFHTSGFSFLDAFMWLMFSYGDPICILPSTQDFSGLESRLWKETIALIDKWTNYDTDYSSQRSKYTSAVLVDHSNNYDCEPYIDDSFQYHIHLVGGEIIYQLFGRIYKFDGFRSNILILSKEK